MAPNDVIGLYGAILATAVAVVQVYEHFIKRRILNVVQSNEFSDPKDYVCLIITNLSVHQINFEFIGIGSAVRKWVTPWQITLEEATSCRPFILAEKQEIYVDSIEPSKVVYLEEKIAVSRKKRLKMKGLHYPICLVVDHSLSQRTFIRPL
ncbi:MAG: hypothetical protein LKF30_06080 [Sphingobium sp.]|jgi:hypothetical protein|nr:hypothetical protein [Sphingobium sp.]MCI1271734.1 hypothetical protein [Sphingobium sp.]MCI2054052.1 hypothetical protein [Sphingobium sp.]